MHVFIKTFTNNHCFIIIFLLAIIPPAHAVEPVWTYTSPGNEIGGVSVSADGSAIAVAGGKIWLFSRKGTLLAKEPFGDQVVITPGGSSLVASYWSTLYLFKRTTSPAGSESPLQKLWEISLPAEVRSIDISDNGNSIVASTQGGGTYFYDSTGKQPVEIKVIMRSYGYPLQEARLSVYRRE